jgi:integrase
LLPQPPDSREAKGVALTPAQAILRKLVLDAVQSPHARRNYAKALDDLFQFCASRPLSRAFLIEWKAGMEPLSTSTINVRLSAVRKMLTEAKHNGMIGPEEAANLTDVPNIRQKGTRLRIWLTREQAKELLAVPDRSTLKGKRDYVILALLVGCALRRNELAELDIATIQQREGRCVLADLEGKGRRIRTVAVPIWVKQGIEAGRRRPRSTNAGFCYRCRSPGKVNGDRLSDWAVWSVVEQSSKQIGIEHFGAHDLRRTCANLC